MFHDPIQQRALKTDIMPRFFAFDPLMAQNLLTLGQKLPVQRRVHHHIFRVAAHFTSPTHGVTLWSHHHQEAYLIPLTLDWLIAYSPVECNDSVTSAAFRLGAFRALKLNRQSQDLVQRLRWPPAHQLVNLVN